MKNVLLKKLAGNTQAIQLFLDVLMLSQAFALACVLGGSQQLWRVSPAFLAINIAQILLLQLGLLYVLNIQARVWRYVNLADLTALTIFAASFTAIFLTWQYILPDFNDFRDLPANVVILNGLFAFIGLASLRVFRRVFHERNYKGSDHEKPGQKIRTLLVGAGEDGVLAARAIRNSPRNKLDLVGFIDDDPRKKSAIICQLPVLGMVADLKKVIERNDIKMVVITIPKAAGSYIRPIVEQCNAISVPVRVTPAYEEILGGEIKVNHIRDVKIEDLLRREAVELDLQSIGSFLNNQVVLITGAGGSIGSELARQVMRFNAAQIILFDQSEAALFEIEQELRTKFPKIEPKVIIGDCADEKRVRTVMTRYHPTIVLHAAAYKHVFLMERNPYEAIESNVLGTKVVATVAGEVGVHAFILVSTDKAVKPTSVMGASKRMAEGIIAELSVQYATRYMAVRFGNVLGSSGSVVPIFKRQIASGGPITVTHPDMVRYFMTIPEACQLILQAACTGHSGDLFILDMGKPVRIIDLAEDIIRLSGLKPYEDIDIVFVGQKPGEKIAEELHSEQELASKTMHPRIYQSRLSVWKPFNLAFGKLTKLIELQDEQKLKELLIGTDNSLAQVLPEQPINYV